MTKNNLKSVSTCGVASFENSLFSLMSNGPKPAFRNCEYDRRQVEKDYYLPSGMLDGLSIDEAEVVACAEDGELDRYIKLVSIERKHL